MDRARTCCFTGHRPEKLPWRNNEADPRCIALKERLDKALLEASYDLGAGRVKTFFRITLPMTMPGVYAAAIISFVPSIGNYFVADVLGGSKTLLIGNLIKDQFMSSRNWPLGSALSVFLIAGTMILVYLYARVSRADVMEGGL